MTFTPNSLSQRDPRWQDINLGFDKVQTIGTQGCVLASLAMLATGYGYTETPETLNKKLMELGSGKGFIGPLMVWAGMTRLYPKIGIKEIFVCSDTKPVPFKRIDALLSNGQAVMVECDRSLASGDQAHWVILTKKKGEDYVMLDPWPYPADKDEILLTSRYGFGRPLQQVITAVAFYECWQTAKESAPLPSLPGLFVRIKPNVTTGLNVRLQPNSTATVVSTEIPAAPFLVLDEASDALARIGVTDQWLKVRDPQGYDGYFPAWYVEKLTLPAPEPEPGPKPEPQPEPKPEPKPEPPPPFLVFVSAEVGSRGLRLRSQPSLDSVVLTVLKASEKLEVIESAETARSKIGVQSQWVNVRTVRNETGFCAAWLVVLPAVEPPPPVPTPQPQPEPQPEPKPEPKPESPPLKVIISQSVGSLGLRLRSAPVNGTVLVVLPAGTKLTVVEPAETARSKIGVVNQWLNVKDDAGHTGFTAAWFVQLVPASEVGSTTSGDSNGLSVYVSTTVGSVGLRLRSAPNTTSSTIRNLPALSILSVLEPATNARPKIGVFNQWLNVRTPDGVVGYVAAWYVMA